MGELFLGEVPLKAEMAEAGAELREDRRVTGVSLRCHRCQHWQRYWHMDPKTPIVALHRDRFGEIEMSLW